MISNIIIKIGEVESVYDEYDGLRIKVRLSEDKNISISELPYAFPLLPKVFQSVPKIGESVFVLTATISNSKVNRYYIGPIISQAQKFERDPNLYGKGSATSLINGSVTQPLERISNYSLTDGAFPNINDVAIIGRKSEDVTLKDGEIDLRCGIRQKGSDIDPNLEGNIIFNKINPSYIQLKYRRGIGHTYGQEADSVINLVADKINIISHKDENALNLTDKNELIKSKELDEIMTKLHQLPYGDLVVKALDLIRESIVNHVHPYPGLPPCNDKYIKNLNITNFTDILSDNVRIS